MKQNFQVELLSEAIEFLENLDDKTGEKIYYNIKKAQFVNDNELFKNLMTSFGNLGLCITARLTDFFHFGTQQIERKFWLWRHTEF